MTASVFSSSTPAVLERLAALVAALTTLLHLRGALRVGTLRWVEDQPVGSGPRPTLSLVVAARDEARGLPAALDSWLAAPDLPDQVVVVDDRSADETPSVLQARAARDPRLLVRRVDVLPAGWLGKVHALEVGSKAAGAEYLLFTDADVRIDPEVLRRALRLASAEGLDHLTVIPRYDCRGFALRLVVTTATSLLIAGARAHAVGRGRRRAHFGLGAFNLVRRAKWEEAGGEPPQNA